ncbi:MAG TPA: uracil-DNA glycosylase [Vicinamibacterales bacterium]|nr:uracil-DNA glycosylase [Vicinamibacterales bacterium]
MSRQEIAAHLQFLRDLGVTGVSRDPAWREREGDPAVEPAAQSAPGPGPEAQGPRESIEPAADGALASFATLDALRAHIGPACTRCKLCKQGRSQVVFGVGNPKAELMFVGEAPGADEDRLGEPFVGRAGQLLTKIIETMFDCKRSDVYIANVIKCRPPENRNPEPDEIAVCEPFLNRQIELIGPRVIVALGTFAAKALLKTETPISRLRGRVHDFRGGIKLVATFHPAFLLRSPDRKRDVWEDMKKVRALLDDRG